MKKRHDDGLEWLRKIRCKMAEEFKHDPKRMGDFYRRMQRNYQSNIYRREDHPIGSK